MKKKLFAGLFLALAMCLSFSACGKVSSPQSGSGDTGTVWDVGEGAPDAETGKNGDFYFDTAAYALYRKRSNAWVFLGTIKGTQGEQGIPGAAGEDGTAWLVDHGRPTDPLGKNGDLYLDLETYDVYQKGVSAWSKIGNIKGADGESGRPGESGSAAITYTVIFQDWDGTILKLATNVRQGEKVEAPDVPLRMNYEFTGWDGNADSVTSDLILHAQYRSLKQYDDLYAIKAEKTDEKLTLHFSFAQSAVNPAPIMAFQVRVLYDGNYTCLDAKGADGVSCFIHEDAGYISVAYLNYAGEMIDSTFDFLTAEFDVSRCVAGDKITLEIKYIVDIDGQEISESVKATSSYIFGEEAE